MPTVEFLTPAELSFTCAVYAKDSEGHRKGDSKRRIRSLDGSKATVSPEELSFLRATADVNPMGQTFRNAESRGLIRVVG